MLRIALLIAMSVLLFGCSHEKSYFKKAEDVSIVMLSESDICKNPFLAPSYNVAFNETVCKIEEETKKPPLVYEGVIGPLPLLAAGLGVDQLVRYASKEIRKEAKKHVAEFEAGKMITDFWEEKERMKYAGFKIVRSAQNGDKVGCDNAYEAYFGMRLDKSKDFIWVAPLSFRTECAKPKVSKCKGAMTSTTQLAFESVWVDDKNVYHRQNLATITPISIDDYSLNTRRQLVNCAAFDKEHCFERKEASISTMPKVPVSDGLPEAGNGYLWIRAVVTEADKSKLDDNMLVVSDQLDKNRDKIVEGVKKQLKP